MTLNHEIKEKTELLDRCGRLIEKGYATKMNFIYNRDCVKSFPLKLKEWNFYQFIKDHYVVQLTIGHVSYMCSVTATLIDLATGEKHELNAMKPLYVPELDRDPEGESFNEFTSEDFYMSFQVTGDKRLLYVKGKNEKYQNVEIRLVIDNDIANEKMVIATPFWNPKQFYLNYKENYYSGTGEVRFEGRSCESRLSEGQVSERQSCESRVREGQTSESQSCDITVDFDGCTGLIDWGRGVWPYSHEWFWGNLSSHIDGVPFGFNIGWGFGDLRNATENMYFYNKKAYKVGRLMVKRDKNDYMQPWKLKDEENKIRMLFTPIYDNYTENKYVVVNTHCDQVYGLFSGVIETEDGPKKFRDVLAFIEHAVNRW